MAGTVLGGKRAAKTNRERHGAHFYNLIGKEGGLTSRGGGFRNNRQLAREAGAKGGRISSRRGTKNRRKKSPM